MDSVDKSDSQRFLGGHLPPRENHFRGIPWADQSGEALAPAPSWRDTQPNLRLGKASVLRGQSNVTSDGQLAPAAKRVSIDGGNDWLWQSLQRAGYGLTLPRELQSFCRVHPSHCPDVGSSRKRSVSRSRQYDGSHGPVEPHLMQRTAEPVELLRRERVESFRPVHRDDRHAVTYFDVNRHLRLPQRAPGT